MNEYVAMSDEELMTEALVFVAGCRASLIQTEIGLDNRRALDFKRRCLDLFQQRRAAEGVEVVIDALAGGAGTPTGTTP